MNKKSILKGTIIIAFANVLAKFIGVFFKIPLTNMIGEKGMGIYSYPYPLFLVFIALSISGPPVAIAKLISEKKAINDHNGIRILFDSSLKLMFYIGVLTSFIIIVSSKAIVYIFWPKEALYPLLALSLSPIFLSLMSVFKGYYQGHQQMAPTAYAQTADSLVRLIVGLGLAFLLRTNGITASVTGAAFGTTAGSVIGLLTIYIIYLNDNSKYPKVIINKKEQKDIIKQIMMISIPISIGAIGGVLMPLIDTLLIKSRLLEAGFNLGQINSYNGILSNVNTLSNLPLSIGVAVGINLVPSISSARFISKDLVLIKIRSGLIMMISIALPSSIGMLILSKRIFKMFFPTMSTNHYLMEILSIGIFFIMLSQVFISVLQALDFAKIPVRNIYFGVLIKFTLSYLFISNSTLNINGAALSTTIAFGFIMVLNGLSCYKLINFKIDFKFMIILPIMNVLIMSIVVITSTKLLSIFTSNNSIITICSVLLGILIYGILIIITKVVSIKSIPFLNKIIRR